MKHSWPFLIGGCRWRSLVSLFYSIYLSKLISSSRRWSLGGAVSDWRASLGTWQLLLGALGALGAHLSQEHGLGLFPPLTDDHEDVKVRTSPSWSMMKPDDAPDPRWRSERTQRLLPLSKAWCHTSQTSNRCHDPPSLEWVCPLR